jgi:hypothetical protein
MLNTGIGLTSGDEADSKSDPSGLYYTLFRNLCFYYERVTPTYLINYLDLCCNVCILASGCLSKVKVGRYPHFEWEHPVNEITVFP